MTYNVFGGKLSLTQSINSINFTKRLQKIFKCDDLQNGHLIADKELNIFRYRTYFCFIIYRSCKLRMMIHCLDHPITCS